MRYKIIRMKWRTYKNIRKKFPATRNETASSYFERLQKSMMTPMDELSAKQEDYLLQRGEE